MPLGVNMNPIRPVGEEGQKTQEAIVLRNDAYCIGFLLRYDLAEKTSFVLSPVSLAGGQLGSNSRGYEREGIDLTVWVVECCADFTALVLENEDVLDVRIISEPLESFGP